MKSPARKRACVETARADDSPSHAADIFLLHGGMQHFSTRELLSTFGCVGRRFRRHARDEFNDRLRRRHPSLVAAAGPDDINGIGWREWRRFEMGEEESRKSGERLEISMTNLLEDHDVLLEVTKNDGEGEAVVWHGVEPLRQGEHQLECKFTLPHISFNAPKPAEGDVLGRWVGLQSLQEQSIHKALKGINCPPFLSVQVVMRRRSDGKMATVLSAKKASKINDYHYDARRYMPFYVNSTTLLEEEEDYTGERNVESEIAFDLYSSEELHDAHGAQGTIPFTSRSNEKGVSSETDELGARVYFNFMVFANGVERPSEENFVLQAMQSWKWS